MARIEDVREIRLDQLVIGRRQVRTRDVEADLDELVDNLRVHGQLEPILVARVDANGSEAYEIVAGQRRFLAAKRLGWEAISSAVLQQPVDEATARVLSVSENLIRRDLAAKDLVDVCTELHRRYGSIKAVSEELGLPYGRVRTYVKFERLRPQLQGMVRNGELDVQTALRIDDQFGDEDVNADMLRETAKTVADMTNAQKADYFRNDGPKSHSQIATDSRRKAKPGEVRQVVVTLSKEDHASLRRWAAHNGTGQDRAAAMIIGSFLRSESARLAVAR